MHHLFILLSTSIHRLMNTSIRCTQTSQSITLFFKLINIKLRTKLTVLSFTYYYNRKKKQLILQPDNLYTPARMAGIYFIDHFRHNLGIIINSDNFLTLITANVLWENNSNTWLNMILAYVHINFLFSVKVSLLVEFLHSLEKNNNNNSMISRWKVIKIQRIFSVIRYFQMLIWLLCVNYLCFLRYFNN